MSFGRSPQPSPRPVRGVATARVATASSHRGASVLSARDPGEGAPADQRLPIREVQAENCLLRARLAATTEELRDTRDICSRYRMARRHAGGTDALAAGPARKRTGSNFGSVCGQSERGGSPAPEWVHFTMFDDRGVQTRAPPKALPASTQTAERGIGAGSNVGAANAAAALDSDARTLKAEVLRSHAECASLRLALQSLRRALPAAKGGGTPRTRGGGATLAGADGDGDSDGDERAAVLAAADAVELARIEAEERTTRLHEALVAANAEIAARREAADALAEELAGVRQRAAQLQAQLQAHLAHSEGHENENNSGNGNNTNGGDGFTGYVDTRSAAVAAVRATLQLNKSVATDAPLVDVTLPGGRNGRRYASGDDHDNAEEEDAFDSFAAFRPTRRGVAFERDSAPVGDEASPLGDWPSLLDATRARLKEAEDENQRLREQAFFAGSGASHPSAPLKSLKATETCGVQADLLYPFERLFVLYRRPFTAESVEALLRDADATRERRGAEAAVESLAALVASDATNARVQALESDLAAARREIVDAHTRLDEAQFALDLERRDPGRAVSAAAAGVGVGAVVVAGSGGDASAALLPRSQWDMRQATSEIAFLCDTLAATRQALETSERRLARAEADRDAAAAGFEDMKRRSAALLAGCRDVAASAESEARTAVAALQTAARERDGDVHALRGQLAAMQRSLDATRAERDDAERHVETLKSRVTTLSQSVARLREDYSGQAAALQDARQHISAFSARAMAHGAAAFAAGGDGGGASASASPAGAGALASARGPASGRSLSPQATPRRGAGGVPACAAVGGLAASPDARAAAAVAAAGRSPSASPVGRAGASVEAAPSASPVRGGLGDGFAAAAAAAVSHGAAQTTLQALEEALRADEAAAASTASPVATAAPTPKPGSRASEFHQDIAVLKEEYDELHACFLLLAPLVPGATTARELATGVCTGLDALARRAGGLDRQLRKKTVLAQQLKKDLLESQEALAGLERKVAHIAVIERHLEERTRVAEKLRGQLQHTRYEADRAGKESAAREAALEAALAEARHDLVLARHELTQGRAVMLGLLTADDEAMEGEAAAALAES